MTKHPFDELDDIKNEYGDESPQFNQKLLEVLDWIQAKYDKNSDKNYPIPKPVKPKKYFNPSMRFFIHEEPYDHERDDYEFYQLTEERVRRINHE